MADELAEKLAKAKKKMFGSQQSQGSQVVLLVRGDAEVTSSDSKVVVRRV